MPAQTELSELAAWINYETRDSATFRRYASGRISEVFLRGPNKMLRLTPNEFAEMAREIRYRKQRSK